MSDIQLRLERVRAVMKKANLDAFIVPRADEYLGEYIPAFNERLKWISGFTGSAGVVIVLQHKAAIFVDGRYTVQVAQQVDLEVFEYHHLIDEPHMNWLAHELGEGGRVGVDTRLHNLKWYNESQKTLETLKVEIVNVSENPIDICWNDRPTETLNKALLLADNFTGLTSDTKRRTIAASLLKENLDAGLIFAPDSVAWLLNIRGQDVPCFPIILGYGLLRSDGQFTFFTNPEKIPDGFAAHVGENVDIVAENEAQRVLTTLKNKRVLADPQTANAWTQLTLKQAGAELVAGIDPVLLPKARKNNTEIEGMKQAHIRDGVAEVSFLHWLDKELAQGVQLNEAITADKLLSFRQQQAHFQEVSFDTISAAGANAAMCHYNHNNADAPADFPTDGVYLVDSGGQYLDGTTDITRTVALGKPSNDIKKMFTLVLKGHIALDNARFPYGTTGTQLDAFARQFLWQQGFDYDHGTGHGVGAFLSVHEGPQRIAKVYNGTALEPGMIVSNEPGYYKANHFGIRCENLVFVKEAEQLNGDVPMLQFEALTLAPFDTRLVEKELLTVQEINWLNSYHQLVLDTLSDFVSDEVLAWLKTATKEI